MIELNAVEIDEISGAMGFLGLAAWGNAVLEFLTGWVDGVNDATRG